MFKLLKLFINKKVEVIYIKNGIEKQISGTLILVDDYRGIVIEEGVFIRLGFISNFCAIKKIKYLGIPIYNNIDLPPHYGYNPLKLPSNINEKNKQKAKLYKRAK